MLLGNGKYPKIQFNTRSCVIQFCERLWNFHLLHDGMQDCLNRCAKWIHQKLWIEWVLRRTLVTYHTQFTCFTGSGAADVTQCNQVHLPLPPRSQRFATSLVSSKHFRLKGWAIVSVNTNFLSCNTNLRSAWLHVHDCKQDFYNKLGELGPLVVHRQCNILQLCVSYPVNFTS